MKNRGVLAAAVLSAALVSGGWLMQRGSVTQRRDLKASAHLFDEVLQHIRRDFVDTLADSTIYRHAITGALRELHDPHTVFLNPRRLSRLEEATTGQYAGVGIQMDVRDSGITVIGTLAGSPAEDAGIVTGDRVVAIDGKSTRGSTAEEAVKLMRGAAGTKVSLVVERPGVADSMPFTFARRMIKVNPVQHALLLSDGVGYVDLTSFSAEATSDLTGAIDSLRSVGARAMVFDLRGDPGGLLDQGVAIADLFLNPGQAIVETRGRNPEENRAFADRSPQRWADMPLVVLTDSASASASEIVAGALQDHDRAVLIGTTTYGKGSAQRVFRVDDGAVKVTTALWYTPSGRSINRPRPKVDDDEEPVPDDSVARPKFRTAGGRTILGGGGIVPDVEIPPRVPTSGERALQAALGSRIPAFRDAVIEYALSQKVNRTVTDANFVVSPAMRDELYRRLQASGVVMRRAVYDSGSALVDRVLGQQTSRYVFGRRAEYARYLRDDPAMTRAQTLLRGARTQKELLARVSR